jgi:hypothetical protein
VSPSVEPKERNKETRQKRNTREEVGKEKEDIDYSF